MAMKGASVSSEFMALYKCCYYYYYYCYFAEFGSFRGQLRKSG